MLLLLASHEHQPRGPPKRSDKYSCYVAARYQHWAVSLPTFNFTQFLADCKEVLNQEDLGWLSVTLARNGLHEKLKLVIDRVKNHDAINLATREAALIGCNLQYNNRRQEPPEDVK